MYVKVTNGTVDQYPYTVGDLRRDNPNTSFPRTLSTELLASYGLYAVTEEDPQSYNRRTQKIARADNPVLENGSWVMKWVISDKTAEELQAYDNSIADSNRRERNTLLSNSDWTQVSDTPLSDADKALWVTYRQALRDITTHANWPNLNKEDWPTQP